MARVFTEGFELGDHLFWTTRSSGDASAQLVATYGGSGVYCFMLIWGAWCYKDLTTPLTEVYFRCRYRGSPVTKNDGAENMLFHFISGGGSVARVEANKANQLMLVVGGSQVGNLSQVLVNDTWYLLEGYYKMHDTSGSYILKIDGVERCTFVGDTKPGAYTSFNRVQFSGAGSNFGAPYTFFDDVAMNDTSGAVDNSWCGPGKIERLLVNANGDLNEWTPAGQANNWECVDETPSNGDTDYVTAKEVGKRDLFNLTAFTDTNKTVTRLWIEGRAEDYAAVASRIKLGLKTSGSVFLGPETVLPAAYIRVSSGEYLVDPSSGKTWTKTELDALQAVIEAE